MEHTGLKVDILDEAQLKSNANLFDHYTVKTRI